MNGLLAHITLTDVGTLSVSFLAGMLAGCAVMLALAKRRAGKQRS